MDPIPTSNPCQERSRGEPRLQPSPGTLTLSPITTTRAVSEKGEKGPPAPSNNRPCLCLPLIMLVDTMQGAWT